MLRSPLSLQRAAANALTRALVDAALGRVRDANRALGLRQACLLRGMPRDANLRCAVCNEWVYLERKYDNTIICFQ